MKRLIGAIVMLALSCVLIAASPGHANGIDMLTIEGKRYRLYCIDAPESDPPFAQPTP